MATKELMYMNWQEMIRPEKVNVSGSEAYGKFESVLTEASLMLRVVGE